MGEWLKEKIFGVCAAIIIIVVAICFPPLIPIALIGLLIAKFSS